MNYNNQLHDLDGSFLVTIYQRPEKADRTLLTTIYWQPDKQIGDIRNYRVV